ncbi:MAG TPA: NRAMP family divalent metal transporter [Candidatus Acidoferrum sp.]|nr:NRAMP family divalent metal transporter [Candidatus Acidoferrum sp.]
MATLLAIMGPGVVVMVADNDAGGLSVYAQAGQDSMSLIWLLLLLAPVLYVIQEMAARLGAVTGAGHARLIFERFGRRWGYFALADLLVLNLLTIITEFIGVALALGYFGVSRYWAVPFAGLALVVVTGIGSFRRWELTMFSLVGLSLIAVPLAVFSGVQHPTAQYVSSAASTDSLNGGIVLLVVAMIGTTVAPWQLFLQQSNVVDKRITARWLPYERIDLAIGAVLFTIGALAVFVASAVALGGNSGHTLFIDASRVADGLRDRVGWWAGALFAIALLNGSVLGAAAVTLSTSYALGDVSGLKHSLHRRWRDAPIFHGSFACCLLVAAIIVLIPHAPLGVVTVGVQVLSGVLVPSATVFLLLLCNDRAVLGPWANPTWLNVVAVFVVGILIEMSALLTLTTLFPGLHVAEAAVALTLLWAAALAAFWFAQGRTKKAAPLEGSPWELATWTMPRLESLPPPAPSQSRTAGLVVLRVYLVVAAALVVARIAQAIVGA